MLWLRLPGWKESIRAALALEVLDVFVGQLDIALAVSGPQHMVAGMAIVDDVRLHFAGIKHCHPTEGQRCAFGVHRRPPSFRQPRRCGPTPRMRDCRGTLRAEAEEQNSAEAAAKHRADLSCCGGSAAATLAGL